MIVEVHLPDGTIAEVDAPDIQSASKAANLYVQNSKSPTANQNFADTEKYRGFGGGARAIAESIPGGLAESLNMFQPFGSGSLPNVIGKATGLNKFIPDNPLSAHWGDTAKETLGIKKQEDFPPNAQASAFSGNVLGGSIIPGAGLYGLGRSVAKAGMSAAPGAIEKMLYWIGKNPKAYALGQEGAAVGGAAGEHIAEDVAPGNTPLRVGMGLGGSVISPTSLASWAGSKLSNAPGVGTALERGLTAFNPPKAAAYNVGKLINENAPASGQFPSDVVNAIRSAPGVPATVATNNPVFQDMAAQLGSKDPAFQRALKAAETNAMGQSVSGMQTGIGGSTPQDLIEAAKTGATGVENRIAQFGTQAQQRAATETSKLDDALQTANKAANDMVNPIRPMSVAERQTANTEHMATIEDALGKWRAKEHQLWQQVPQDALPKSGGAGVVAAYDAQKAAMLPEENFPPLIENVIKRFKATMGVEDASTLGPSQLEREAAAFKAARGTPEKPPEPVTFKDVQNLRSYLLSESRTARANNDFNLSRRLNALADGAMSDMASVNSDAIKPALDFSRTLNDKFSRAFPGKLLGLNESGAQSIRPELSLETAFSGNAPKAAAQIRELRDVASGPAASLVPTVQNSQEQFTRNLLSQAFDDQGNFNPDRAARIMEANKPIFEQFPGMRDQMRAAIDSGRQGNAVSDMVASSTKDITAKANKAETAANRFADSVRTTGPYGQILGNSEQPHVIIQNAISSSNATPIRDLNRLYNVSGKTPDGRDGLRASIGQFVSAADTPAEAAARMVTPIRPNQPSLLDWMKNRGLVSSSEYDTTMGHANKILEFEAAKRGARADAIDLTQHIPDLFDFGARVGGANIGAIFGHGTGAPLVAAAAGSKEARKALSSIMGKFGSQTETLKNAILNPGSQDAQDFFSMLEKTGVKPPSGPVGMPPPLLFKPAAHTSILSQALDEQRRKQNPNYGALQ